jgi:hypothetical protein
MVFHTLNPLEQVQFPIEKIVYKEDGSEGRKKESKCGKKRLGKLLFDRVR